MKVVMKAFLRYLPRRRGLSVLQLMGISSGVAGAVGMALSSQAALSSFTSAVEFVRGKTTHTLKRPAGPIDERILVRLMHDPSVNAFSPVVDRRLHLHHGELVHVLGIDPFLDAPVRPEISLARGLSETSGNREDALSLILEKQAVLVDERLAEQLEVRAGEFIDSDRGKLRVVGTFPNPSGEPLLLMDIGQSQMLFGLSGLLDRVDLILSNPQDFRSRWSRGFLIQSREQRRAAMGDMLRAFRLNLEALSLLALFVGVFLVYNIAMFGVVSRRRDAGILRSLGAQRNEILLAFLTEILLLGAMGGLLGGVMGYLLSYFLTELLGSTISKLYFYLRPIPAPWSWKVVLYGVVLGSGAGLLGGIFPLIELVRQDPVQTLRGRVASREAPGRAFKAALAGGAILGLSLALMSMASNHVYMGFAGAFALLVGATMLTGLGLLALRGPLEWLFQTVAGLPGKIAAGNVHQNLGRTAVAVAAFMVALSMSIGLGSMIGSFRETLYWWMDSQLRGDLYIAPSREVEVPEAFFEEIQSIPGVGGLDPYRNVQILYRGTPVRLTAINAAVLQEYTRFGWIRGGNENWGPVKRGAVIISESFHRRFNVDTGDQITLEGVRGPARLEVAGLFYDYTTEHGLIMMDRSTYIRLFDDTTIDSLAVFMKPDDPKRQSVLQRVKETAQAWGLPVSSRDQFHGTIVGLFDATFAVTRSMRFLAVVVAFFGIAGALLTLFMERQREFGIYRALGFSTAQASSLTLLEGLGMGLASLLFSTLVGTALAWVLIRVINLHSFNWTIFYSHVWSPYLNAALTTLLASVGAAAYPIWRIYRTYPQMQLRDE